MNPGDIELKSLPVSSLLTFEGGDPNGTTTLLVTQIDFSACHLLQRRYQEEKEPPSTVSRIMNFPDSSADSRNRAAHLREMKAGGNAAFCRL